MKISFLITILILISISNVYAQRTKFSAPFDQYFDDNLSAQIIVLEAPIFARPSYKSQVLQSFRKGDYIFINPKHERSYYYEENPNLFMDEDDNPLFYQTITRSGNIGYIPRDFVKVLYQDKREFAYRPLPHDPTDYRIEEPISDTYPFRDISRHKLIASVGLGSQMRSSYNYNESITNSNYGNYYQASMRYLYNPTFDRLGNFFFGGMANIVQASNTFSMGKDDRSDETWLRIGVGPYATYRIYQHPMWQLHLGGGVSYYLYDRIVIEKEKRSIGIERRIFEGFGINPKAEMIAEFPKLLKHIDGVIGFSLEYQLFGQYSPTSQSSVPGMWNSAKDEISTVPGIQSCIFIGLQARN